MASEMTGRERIAATFAGKPVDRMPVEVGSTEFSGVAADAYLGLKSALNVDGGKTRMLNPFNGMVRLERQVRDRLGTDAVGLFPQPRRWKEGRLSDGSPCLMPERWSPHIGPHDTQTIDLTLAGFSLVRRLGEKWFNYEGDRPPLADCATPADVARRQQAIALFDWPYHADELASEFGVRAAEKRAQTDAAVVLNVRARLIGGALILRGPEIFRDFEERPDVADAILGRLADAFVARLTDLLPEVAPHADVVCVVEGPSAELTAEHYRRFIKPLHERIYRHIRSTSGKPLLVYSKGLPAWIAAEMRELGVAGFGLSAFPGTATPREIRKITGGEMTIWGSGVGAGFLAGTPEAVRERVRGFIEEAGGPDRWVFALGETLPAGVNFENLQAMLEEVRSFGR